jgi:hypothetical protein
MHDERLMTYPELGEFLGRSEEAARQLAKRRRWRRIISNEDGRARVAVPVEFLEAPRPPVEPRTEDEPDTGQPEDDHPDALSMVVLLREQIERLDRDLAAARTALDEERIRAAQVDVLKAVLESERARLEDARAAETRRVEDMRADRDRWQAKADEALAALLERTAVDPRMTDRPRFWWPFKRAG